ncbi:hypothetical protein ACVMGC_003524 [Bradyrhizobium barranii subsp. barranii]|uniref:Uncharacterized protein n=1 Tax=Bradyrhizobium huanghuaihaiense TaxID=990078 RepID=A0A562QTG3_9BRAD|nr:MULTISPECIES: hypothetical protein [Bradyrhizobium]WLB95702.1 hypothetical protein QIH92_39490 [Bradyrhizobium japonicum USDA 123]MBR1004403.1 hypothetical protein [Bradyrhizobium liaoningense]MBR1071110.1 hypothetical protein [Bradyrhizobium liaoningense]MCP1738597.1 hypothetical protein [Bradyrhizobium japonicum]MCW2320054.1 hypothetical protein [Bradyrhizobium japonicum]
MPNDTTERGYPLPHPDNVAREDAQRIRDALTAISEDMEAMIVDPASETEKGTVRLATAAEATAGTTQVAVPVVKRVKDMITSATAVLHTTIVDEYGAAITSAITSAINDLKGGVDPAYDTLVEIAAKLTDMTQINAILSSLGNRLRIDTAAQGLDATQKSNGRTNIGLGSVSTKNIATTAELRNNTNAGAVTVDAAWAAADYVDLGNVSGTVTLDGNNGSRFRMVLVGAVTFTQVNFKKGQPLDLLIFQDPTGGRTISWQTYWLWPNGTVPAIATAGNAVALIYSGVFNFAGWFSGGGWKVS